MITQSTLWKKAFKCNVTFVNKPALTSEYLRSQLLFVSLLCKSATPNSTLSLHHHPRLKNLCLHHDSGTAGTEGPWKKPERSHLWQPEQRWVPALQLTAGQVKTYSTKQEFALTWEGWGEVRVWGGRSTAAPCQRSRPGNGEGGILLAR